MAIVNYCKSDRTYNILNVSIIVQYIFNADLSAILELMVELMVNLCFDRINFYTTVICHIITGHLWSLVV